MSQALLTRRYQVFRAHLAEDEEFPIAPSPWFSGSDVCLPLEHWEALRAVADERHFVDPRLWDAMSRLDEFYCEEGELHMFIGGLRQLQKALRADMTVMLTRTSRFSEPLPGWEHARMLDAVLAALELAGTEVESYVDGAENHENLDDESDGEQE